MPNTVGMTSTTRDVNSNNVPAEDLDFLRPFAIRNGHNKSDAAAARWAVIELASRLRKEQQDDAASSGAA